MAIIDQFSISEINKIDISEAVVTLDNNTYIEDGTGHTKQVVSVVLNNQTLTEGMDYVVTGNVAQTAGTHTITIVGIGQYGESCTATWTINNRFPALSQATPAEIQTYARNDVARTIWAIGDYTAPIELTDFAGKFFYDSPYLFCAYIIGFNHNQSVEGIGIHFQFGITTTGINIAMKDEYYELYTYEATFAHRVDDSNITSWKDSHLRYLCQELYYSFPSNWQSILTECSKYTDNGKSHPAYFYQNDMSITEDAIFLLSVYEVYGTAVDSYDEDWITNRAEEDYLEQYDYYKNGNSVIKYAHSDPVHFDVNWWLRSPSYYDDFCYVDVADDGVVDLRSNTCSLGFAPGFFVG